MLKTDALNILNLEGEITRKTLKKAFITATKKYHPDVNPAGEDMMKMINEAHDELKELSDDELLNLSSTIKADAQDFSFPEMVNNALNAIKDCIGLKIEICGSWVWVTGDTRTHKELLKGAGFKYASKKKAWSFRSEKWKSKSRGFSSMEQIRENHGSTAFNGQHTFALV